MTYDIVCHIRHTDSTLFIVCHIKFCLLICSKVSLSFDSGFDMLLLVIVA